MRRRKKRRGQALLTAEPANETNAMWRHLKREMQERRDRREVRAWTELFRMEGAGQLGYQQFTEHHLRVWIPGREDLAADYWPRTGTLRLRGVAYPHQSPREVLYRLTKLVTTEVPGHA